MEESRDPETGEKRLDGWPIGTCWRFPQPRSLELRLAHARKFRELFSFPPELEFVVDTIDNSFNRQYAAWPDSAYMMRRGELHYRSQLEDGGFRSAVFTKHINALLEE